MLTALHRCLGKIRNCLPQNNGVNKAPFGPATGAVEEADGTEGVTIAPFVPAIVVLKGATFAGANWNCWLYRPTGFGVNPVTGFGVKPPTGFGVKPVAALGENPVMDRFGTWLGVVLV